MSLIKQFNSKYLIRFGIKICQWTPRKLAMSLIEPVSWLIARFKKSDLIKAVRSNQRIIRQDESPSEEELDRAVRDVFRHALICYYDFFHNINDPEKMAALFPGADDLNRSFDQATREEGALVIAPHISNFNLLYQVISQKGFQAKLLTLSALYSGYDFINRIRSQAGVEIVPIDQGNFFAETVEHLKSGGIAVTAVDRPVPIRKHKKRLNFFGYPSALPAGYIALALAADVPIIIVTTLMREDGAYEFLFSDRIRLQEYGNKLDNLLKNGQMILDRMEEIIKLAPHQWLMYYPVWPDKIQES